MEILYILFGMFFLIGISVIMIYNSIISLYERVKQAWADVLVQENQKQKIIPKLQEALSGYKELEDALLTKITELRSSNGNLSRNEIDVQKLKDVEKQSSNLMSSLNIAVEAYPDLKSSELYQSLMAEITEQQENVGAALRIFNSNVQSFNTTIQSVPANIVNGLFNKREVVDMFEEEQASESIGFTPNL